MFSKIRIALGLTLILVVLVAAPVFAGGWAVITLDELPTDIVAGEPLTVGFTVLQHGKTPMNDLDPTVIAMLNKEAQFVVNAEPEGKPGHYTATLTFPKEGEWQWSIQAFTLDQRMPMLSVAAPVVSSTSQSVKKYEPAVVSTLLIVRMLTVGIGLAGFVVAYRRKSRWAAALTVFCLVVGAASFMPGSAVPEVKAQRKSASEALGNPSISPVELGGRLFVAKGCITCHANNKVVHASEYWVIDAGPNLTKFSASPEALRLRLKDPSSVKLDTQMPNLNLTGAEIEALIAFINSK